MRKEEQLKNSVLQYIKEKLLYMKQDLLSQEKEIHSDHVSLLASELSECPYLVFFRKRAENLINIATLKTAVGKYLHHRLENEKNEFQKKWGRYIVRGSPDMLFEGYPVEIKMRREILDAHLNTQAFNQAAIYAYLARKRYGYVMFVSRYNKHSVRNNIRVYRVFPDYYKIEERIRLYIKIIEGKIDPPCERSPSCKHCLMNTAHQTTRPLPRFYYFEIVTGRELLKFMKHVASRIEPSEYTQLFCSRFHSLLEIMREGKFEEIPELYPYAPKLFVKTNTYRMLREYGLYDSIIDRYILHAVILDSFPRRPYPSTLLDMEYAMKKFQKPGILVYLKSTVPLEAEDKSIKTMSRVYLYQKLPNIEPAFRNKAHNCKACPFKQVCEKIAKKLKL